MSRAAASEAKSSRPIGPPHHKTKLNTFLLHRARRIFFLKENGGRILPPKAAFRGQSPLCFPKKHKKICSRPMVLGRERTYASWCHPNSRQTVSFGLLLRGGSRGRFRPRSAAVLRLVRTGNFQPCLPLCGSVVRVLLRHLRGGFSTILCDFRTNVKGKTVIRYGNPGRPGQGPAPAFRRWRCCWRRGCCCGRTGGKYSAPRW